MITITRTAYRIYLDGMVRSARETSATNSAVRSTTTNSLVRLNKTHAVNHNICDLCVPGRRRLSSHSVCI